MKIKKYLGLLTVLFLSYLTFSSCSNKKPDANNKEDNPFGITSNTGTQILQPCHWSFSVEQSDNGEAILVSTAKLDSGWHLYSQHISDNGPRTEFAYDSLDTYKFLGDTQEGKPSKEYNPYLEMEVLYFEKEAVFKQKIEVLGKMDFTIAGTIDYMVCLDQSQCVHSDEEFSFQVKGNPSEIN
jgi:thiol:disulfide interchange protein DsbD